MAGGIRGWSWGEFKAGASLPSFKFAAQEKAGSFTAALKVCGRNGAESGKQRCLKGTVEIMVHTWDAQEERGTEGPTPIRSHATPGDEAGWPHSTPGLCLPHTSL